MNTQTIDNLDVNSPERKQIELNTGIDQEQRATISEGLQKLLADSYCLMMVTQNYHWNIQGPGFRDVHLITEEHYNNLFGAIDEIAERIRSLGFLVDGTLKDFNDVSDINIPNGKLSQNEMILDLLNGHEVVSRTARSILDSAGESKDEVTVDLLTQRMEFHETTAWMLRSMLER
ncbi:MAG: non-specific DNA-binding protein DpsA [Salibacteraceae bacterium]